MTKLFYSKTLFSILFSAAFFLLSGCEDTCEQTYNYTLYEPVYMSVEEFKAAVKSESPTALKKPGKIYIKGKFLFINEINKGIHVFNNENPAAPQNVSFINIPGNVDLAVQGNILYADSQTDLVTIDISNPLAVQVVKRIENNFPSALQMPFKNTGVDASKGIVVDWIAKETREITSCQASTMPTPTGDVWMRADMAPQFFSNSSANKNVAPGGGSGKGGSMARFTIYDRFLYTIDNSTMHLYDISVPQDPVAGEKINLGWGIETIFPYKDKLFIGSQTGMLIYDNSNPSLPTYISAFTHARACDPVVVDDRYAYVTLREGSACQGAVGNQLDVVDISNIQQPTLVKSYPMGNPHGLGIDGSSLFICDGSHGLKLYDASDVHKIDKNLVAKKAIHSYDVIPFNNIAIVVGEDGLYQFDYSNPADLKLLSKIEVEK